MSETRRMNAVVSLRPEQVDALVEEIALKAASYEDAAEGKSGDEFRKAIRERDFWVEIELVLKDRAGR